MLNRNEIANSLRQLGLKEGDIVLLHSSYLSLGPVEGGPDAVIAAFLDAIGGSGTLLAPAFDNLGILADKIKELPGAIVSSCPCAAVAAFGPMAAELCVDHWKADTAHGENTPYTRLAERGGYVCLLGCDQDRNTTLHSVEAMLHLPYLKTRTYDSLQTPDGQTVSHSYHFFPGPHRDFIGIDSILKDGGAMVVGRIGNAICRLIKSKDMIDLLTEYAKDAPDLFLCENPACADCIGQRATLMAAEFAKESFQLTASARLAGRYVPEICENLAKAGIRQVELDYLQGKAAMAISADKLAKAVAELKEAGIAVSALRLPAVPFNATNLLEKLGAADIQRVVMPLPSSGKTAVALAKENISVSLANAAQTALCATSDFASIQKELTSIDGNAASAATFCFNAAQFAQAGEMPFLNSYKAGHFLKTIGQLDVADCLWDGTPTRLAQGNAEIKELISILRCSSFNGFLCLGGGASFPGTLQEATENLRWLLDNM